YNLAAPADTLKGQTVTGKFEMDWQNGQGVTPESRPLPRIRHAYIQLQHGPQQWLFGQTWDLISPLYPSPNDDTPMWGAGNLGDRDGQQPERFPRWNQPGSQHDGWLRDPQPRRLGRAGLSVGGESSDRIRLHGRHSDRERRSGRRKDEELLLLPAQPVEAGREP